MLVPDRVCNALLKSSAGLRAVVLPAGLTQWFGSVYLKGVAKVAWEGVAALSVSSPVVTKSGLKRPSAVGPRAEKVATFVADRRFPDSTLHGLPPEHVVWLSQQASDMLTKLSQLQHRLTQVKRFEQQGSRVAPTKEQNDPGST